MNWKVVPRKPRNHPSIKRDGPLFAKALLEGDYEKAANIVFGTALEVIGVEGLMNAMQRAFWFMERLKLRKGL